MASRDVVMDAARRLAEAAPPASRVILFGSHARGHASAESDLDFLVVERDLEDRWAEWSRLREAVAGVPAAFDLFVASEAEVELWANVRGTVLHEAVTHGTVVNGG